MLNGINPTTVFELDDFIVKRKKAKGKISDLNAHFTFLPVRRTQTGLKFINNGMCPHFDFVYYLKFGF